MAALIRQTSSSCANPILDLFTSINGVLTDVLSVSFNIWDKSSGTPVQTYPTTPGNKIPVDIATPCPAGGRLATGHYVAAWTVPPTANVGTHQIRWYVKLTASDPEQVYIEEFEVLSEFSLSYDAGALLSGENYCLVQDMRDEGVPASITDLYLLNRIYLASRFIDAATKRFFTPRSLTIKVDGRGGPKILLSDPIIAISEVLFDTTPWAPSATQIEMDLVRVYNRHLSQNLTSPDDRNNPKIELFHPAEMLTHYNSSRTWSRLIFPNGQQNVTITGVFGYTDPSPPSLVGKTPTLIQHACKLLVIRELDKMSRVADRFDRHSRYRLTSERTRDQSYTLDPLGGARGYFTGDPEIDNILALYLRPPAMGAA